MKFITLFLIILAATATLFNNLILKTIEKGKEKN